MPDWLFDEPDLAAVFHWCGPAATMPSLPSALASANRFVSMPGRNRSSPERLVETRVCLPFGDVSFALGDLAAF